MHPSRTGLYYAPGGGWPLTLVEDGQAPPGAGELLGWWLIPVVIAAGWPLKSLTDRAAQWWLRRSRRSHDVRWTRTAT